MKLKEVYFGYNEQYGSWEKLTPPIEVDKYREVFICYEAESVARVLSLYDNFFERIEMSLQHLPDWFGKFYFDIKRRIDNEK